MTAALPGCGSRTPVTEIDVSSSGVELRDAPEISVAWGMWRGPSGQGVVSSVDVPLNWSESESIGWRADVPGRGHGSPIVTDQLVLLPTAIDAQEQQVVVAYDRATGKQRWSTTVHEGGFPSKRETHNKGSNANSTLACDGQHVFAAFFNSGRVFVTALTLDGKIAWQKEIGAFASKFGFAPSPILYRSFVIVAGDNRGGGYIAALDGQSGEIAWRIARPAINSHSTPVVLNVEGKDQLLISGCRSVSSYDPATGEENWSTECTSETTCGTMVSDGTLVFASGGFPAKQTVCLSGAGDIVWTNGRKIYEPSMLVVDDCLYAASDDGILYCWDVESGKEHWKKRLGGQFSSSPWISNGNICVSDLSGNTYVFKHNSATYDQVAKNKLGSDCYATPAVVDGSIFTRIGTRAGGTRSEQIVCIARTENTAN
ncbi:MAG TPA: serine/threonine protein kinase [Planctomycetaceae bacterium]|nr:serine/threonine protein kinase [Planctomycetaceae bacterium]